MKLSIEAETLEEADHLLSQRTPPGEVILSRKVLGDGRPVTIIAHGATSAKAYAKAEANVPSEARIIERHEIRPPRVVSHHVDARDEFSARGQAAALAKAPGATYTMNTELAPSKGVLGLGARPGRWSVEVREPAEVQVLHRAPARIVAQTGTDVEDWEQLIGLLDSSAPTPTGSALAAKWPHQTNFLFLTGINMAEFFKDIPLAPVNAAMIARARRYIDMKTLPGLLGLTEYDPDRYRPTGGGRIGRLNNPALDSALVSVSSCLPRMQLSLSDFEGAARYAFQAIEHYSAIPIVRYVFTLPQAHAAITTKKLDVQAAQIEVYKGAESLLLEIWDELGNGQVITDEKVIAKARRMLLG